MPDDDEEYAAVVGEGKTLEVSNASEKQCELSRRVRQVGPKAWRSKAGDNKARGR